MASSLYLIILINILLVSWIRKTRATSTQTHFKKERNGNCT
jgi:hypothetical protein